MWVKHFRAFTRNYAFEAGMFLKTCSYNIYLPYLHTLPLLHLSETSGPQPMFWQWPIQSMYKAGVSSLIFEELDAINTKFGK